MPSGDHRRCYKCGDEFLLLDIVLEAADGRTSHWCYCPKEHWAWWAKFQQKYMGRNM